jgi:hypothetical protein
MSIAQKTIPATFAAGQSLSNGVLLGDYTLCGFYFPAGWTGAGAITYQISVDNGLTWYELNDDAGAAVSVPAATAASKYYAINPDNAYLTGATMLKLRSGTVAAPVVQTAGCVVTVVGRRIYPGVN